MLNMATAVKEAHHWQSVRTPRQRKNRCLGMMRKVLGLVGGKLPWRSYLFNTALANHNTLAKNPGKWGWTPYKGDLKPGIYLAYFRWCGRLKDGREAGHVCFLVLRHDEKRQLVGQLVSNDNYTWTKFWKAKLVGTYVPI